MKRIHIFCILFFLIYSIKYSEAHVTLEFPIGGEYFFTNDILTIKWRLDVEHNQENWDLYYSKDNGTSWNVITLDLPTEITEYNWVIPDDTTSQALIKVIQDNEGQDYNSVSENFSINEKILTSLEIQSSGNKSFGSITVFPIPSNGEVYFSFELLKSQNIRIEVFDVSGRLVSLVRDDFLSEGRHTISFNTSYMLPGTYLYRLIGEKDFIAGKLIR